MRLIHSLWLSDSGRELCMQSAGSVAFGEFQSFIFWTLKRFIPF